MNEVNVGPQAGPQSLFLSSTANIAIYGGAAGGGKSYALLLEPLRHMYNSSFCAVIFRRNTTQIRNSGGLWDESLKLYTMINATPREHDLEWRFPSGMNLKFRHLEYDKTVYEWQGSQVPLLMFDELCHFSAEQFWYMLSRNRSTSGVPGYIRATCNPDPDSWVRQFIDYWIGADGFPIKSRCGKLRWFIRQGDNLIWGDNKAELEKRYGKEYMPKSVTFIPSLLSDNRILMELDPSYKSNLLALNRVDRERLLNGNWNVRAESGMMFQRAWMPIVEAVPGGWSSIARFWDRAATRPNESNADPDWTRGLKLYKYPNGRYVVADLRSMRDTPGQVEQFVKNVASHDGQICRILAQQDPGSAGVSEAEHFIRMLAGYDVHVYPMSKDKLTRAKPVSAQCEGGSISVLRAPWNEEFFKELENFPPPNNRGHDDIVDCFSGAYNALATDATTFDVLDKLAGAVR